MPQRNYVRLTRREIRNGAFRYTAYLLRAMIDGERIRRQFQDHDEAVAEKQLLDVRAANNGEIRAVNTRLSSVQVIEAESAFTRLGGKSLTAAVDWYLSTYRPPAKEMPLEEAKTAFMADREHSGLRPTQLRDYRGTLKALTAFLPARKTHGITTEDILSFRGARKAGPKTWNKIRGDLHAFFGFCKTAPQVWTQENPVTAVNKFKIPRGEPSILTATRVAELMAFVEGYAGGPRTRLKPGGLVPYFALATFAGLRPSVPHGEIWRLGQCSDIDRRINQALGVIRITPEIAKTKSVRQITIQPNLTEWLRRYPLAEYPLLVTNMQEMVTIVRKRFGLTDDVLRHTFISMHVAKFRSMGAAALEAGNSEAIIRKHYLNLVTEQEAAAFWNIAPAAGKAEVIAFACA